NGAPLVDNRPAFTLSLIPRELDRDPDKRDAALGRLSALIQIPYQELRDAVAKTSPDSFLPVRLRRNLSMEEMQKVEEWKLELPGVIVEVEPQRAYPNSRFAAHLLGYVREASDDQLKAGRYRRGDMVGQTGLERLLDEFLRGKDGGERIEVDAMGRQIRLVQSTEPHPGAQVITTVDRRDGPAQWRRAGHGVDAVVRDRPLHRHHRPQRLAARDAGPESPAAQPHHPVDVPARLRVQDGGGGGRPAGRLADAERPCALHGRVPAGQPHVPRPEAGSPRQRRSHEG